MKRRQFAQKAAAASAFMATPGAALWAQIEPPRLGIDYLVLEKRVEVEVALPQVEVLEFFWYSCPHCNAFEPALEGWSSRLPKDVVLRRVPAAFRDDMVPQQRLFYALDAMGLLGALHAKIFRAIHTEKLALDREASITPWVVSQGADRSKFVALYNSPVVNAKATRATQLLTAFKVEGVPALGIGGRFYTDGEMARNMSRALQVADYLIAEVRRGQA